MCHFVKQNLINHGELCKLHRKRYCVVDFIMFDDFFLASWSRTSYLYMKS